MSRTVHKDAVLDHKIFVVGDSELATRIAALLDAHLIAAVTGDASLENFKGIMASVEGPVKVAFIDCWAEDFSATPEQVIIPMTSASKVVTDRCEHHTHDGAHCEVVHFLPFSSPSNYVARGFPADLDVNHNKTAWFNGLNVRITELSKLATNSSAMSLTNAVRNPIKKDWHCWVKWAEYVREDDGSMKHCRTLTQEARTTMEAAVCSHITKFTSFGRRPVG